MSEAYWLPIIFAGLTALAALVYAVLDGYDLGVGILLPTSDEQEQERDLMIASIGPFWDANETWLVLAVGLMLIAFPAAHSLVFYHLYLPAAFMLIGLIMRGVAFDFRAKAGLDYKIAWDRAFKIGSLMASLSQGYMLGQFVMGFEDSGIAVGFSILSALCVTAAYTYIGACWLVYKTEGDLRTNSISMAQSAGRIAALGVLAVCVINPLMNAEVFSRWFSGGIYLLLWVIPVICLLAFLINDRLLQDARLNNKDWLPIWMVIIIFLCCGLAFCISFYPTIVPGSLTIWEAASSVESLMVILIGAVIVVPIILAYTVYAYWVFRGKASDLRYH